MRFLAPPTPSTQGIPRNPSLQSVQNGQGDLQLDSLRRVPHTKHVNFNFVVHVGIEQPDWGSEANEAISLFNSLSVQQKQNLLNFLRSL